MVYHRAVAMSKPVHQHGDRNRVIAIRARRAKKVPSYVDDHHETSCRLANNSTELARRYRELGGEAEIVLLKDLGARRVNSRGHDGPELYESATLMKFLLAD